MRRCSLRRCRYLWRGS